VQEVAQVVVLHQFKAKDVFVPAATSMTV